MGSKSRIASEILEIILKDRKPDQWFVDIFCGGCNLLDKVVGNRIGNDKNKYLIALFKGLQDNTERPYTITKEIYSKARTEYNNNSNKVFTDFEIGWIGWMGSYNGRFFDGGYSGHSVGVNNRDYISEQIRNTEKQMSRLQGVKFYSKSYDEFDFKQICIIYCDPPYKGTTQYSTSKDFSHSDFWQWCRNMSKKGHTVYISEYNAPEDFKCVWEKEITNSLNTNNTYRPIEKLFTI